jgi:hypothetical protein
MIVFLDTNIVIYAVNIRLSAFTALTVEVLS